MTSRSTTHCSTWIFLVGAIGAAALFAVWSMPPPKGKDPVLLQKEGEEEKPDDSAAAQDDAGGSGGADGASGNGSVDEAAAATNVLYRRYHHWNSPSAAGLPAPDLEACESACSGDSSCFGVTWDGAVKTCAKLPKGNFQPTTGLLGEFTTDEVITSMKDRSLKTDHLDCFGPYKRGETPGRLPPTYCPRSKEAAVNAYFHNSRPMHLFAGMFPGGHQTNMYGQF